MIAIREESRLVESGLLSRSDNPLRNAPHTAEMLLTEQWEHPYTREQAAFPLPWVRARKYWPPVRRVDHVYGDRNLMCACPPPRARTGQANWFLSVLSPFHILPRFSISRSSTLSS